MNDPRFSDVLARLDVLDHELRSARRGARRWRLVALLGLAAAGLGFVPAGSAPVLRAERLEIVDAEGRLVMALGDAEHGGRLDLWSHDGANLVRLGANAAGGDLNVWNDAGRSVIAAWATEPGGELGLWDAGGAQRVQLSAGATEGAVVAHHADRGSARLGGRGLRVGPNDEDIALSLERDGTGAGRLGLAHRSGAPFLLATADDAGGSLVLSDGEGRRRATLAAQPGGGALAVAHRAGLDAAVIGVSPEAEGGYLDLVNGEGHRVFAASALAAGAHLALGAGPGDGRLVLDATGAEGATISLRNAKGRRGVVLGAREAGGLLNLSNRHDVVVLAAGFSPDGLGGALAVRNGRGLAVVEAAATPDERGQVRVSNADGESTRRLDPVGQ